MSDTGHLLNNRILNDIGVPSQPSSQLVNGSGPSTKMLEMWTNPIDVISGRANLIMTQRTTGWFFSSMRSSTQTTRQDSRFMTRDVQTRLVERFNKRTGNNETGLSRHLSIIARISSRIIHQCVRSLCVRRLHQEGGQEVSHDPNDQTTRPVLSNRQRSLDKVCRRDLIKGVLSFQGTARCLDRQLVRPTSIFWAATYCK